LISDFDRTFSRDECISGKDEVHTNTDEINALTNVYFIGQNLFLLPPFFPPLLYANPLQSLDSEWMDGIISIIFQNGNMDHIPLNLFPKLECTLDLPQQFRQS
jgi:hypothetical protein